MTPDTLFATTRTRQFTAAALDSNNNAIASAVFGWSSNATGVATVNGSGLVTAVADGSATIQASSAGINGVRSMRILRLAATHSIAPPSASIASNAGTQLFTGAAADSASTSLPLTWTSRNTGLLTLSAATGSSSTATAVGNGTTRVVLGVAAGPVDSATVTITNQTGPVAPATAAVNIGDFFFKSVLNNTQNPAIDTVAVGGQVTWTWTVANNHSVQSTGLPSFTSSAIKTSGTVVITFNTAGTYTYDCGVHGNLMTGTIIVR